MSNSRLVLNRPFISKSSSLQTLLINLSEEGSSRQTFSQLKTGLKILSFFVIQSYDFVLFQGQWRANYNWRESYCRFHEKPFFLCRNHDTFLMITSSSLVSYVLRVLFHFFAQRVYEQFVCLPIKLSSSHYSLFVESALRLLRTTSEIFNVCLYGGKWKSNDF